MDFPLPIEVEMEMSSQLVLHVAQEILSLKHACNNCIPGDHPLFSVQHRCIQGRGKSSIPYKVIIICR